MRKTIMTVMLAAMCLMTACTENMRSRTLGGNIKVTLPPGQKLVTASWKDADLWYLTRERRPDEKPETFLMQESASFGVMEGTVTFVEQ